METIITPNVRVIMDTLSAFGHEGRIAGGAVRDFLLSDTPKDVDIATTARPEKVIEIFEHRGFNVIPTGIQHGTVTVMIGSEPYEITTLRIDRNPDGRHAEVEFTDDWEQDASRRDFTINAMFMDRHGVIHDFFGGQKDLETRRVRFVGDPDRRIKEDYLRILRFFRFKGKMIESPSWVSREEREAIENNAKGLGRISGERIWGELQKILTGPIVAPVIRLMNQTGVISQIGLGPALDEGAIHLGRRLGANPVTLLVMSSKADISETIAGKFKANSTDRKLASFLTGNIDFRSSDLFDFKKIVINHGTDFARELAIISGTHEIVIEITNWEIPRFPVRGQDLLEKGMKPGPEIGRQLNELRDKWMDSQFSLTRDEILHLEDQ